MLMTVQRPRGWRHRDGCDGGSYCKRLRWHQKCRIKDPVILYGILECLLGFLKATLTHDKHGVELQNGFEHRT